MSYSVDDQCQDERHFHEGGPVTAGQEAAGDGEAVEGEDDPQRDATQAYQETQTNIMDRALKRTFRNIARTTQSAKYIPQKLNM